MADNDHMRKITAAFRQHGLSKEDAIWHREDNSKLQHLDPAEQTPLRSSTKLPTTRPTKTFFVYSHPHRCSHRILVKGPANKSHFTSPPSFRDEIAAFKAKILAGIKKGLSSAISALNISGSETNQADRLVEQD